MVSDTSRASTPCKAQRCRPFTAEETLAVEEYFGGAIDKHVSVSLADCKRFLQSRNLERTPKNIQDKVRSLAKANPPAPVEQ